MKRLAGAALVGCVVAAATVPSARADDPVVPIGPPASLASVSPLAPLAKPGDASFPPLGAAAAFEPLRLSLTSMVFPLAGGFPQCETLGDDVGNSVHGVPVVRQLFVRLMPRLVLAGFSSDGCPIDGGMGVGLTYTVPLRPTLSLVAGAGFYGVPGHGPTAPTRTSSGFRVDVVKQTDAGSLLRWGVQAGSSTGTRGAPAMMTFGGGF